MHFLNNFSIKKKLRVTLMTTIAVTSIACVGGEIVHNTVQPISVYAKAKSKSKSHSVKPKAKKGSTIPSVKPKSMGDFTFRQGGTSAVGSDYQEYITFHTSKVKAIPEGGYAGNWSQCSDVFRYSLPYYRNGRRIRTGMAIPSDQRPSMLYSNIGYLHYNDGDKGITKKPVEIDARVTLVGLYELNPRASESVMFLKNRIGIRHTGGGKAVYDIRFYKHGTNGNPIRFEKTALGFWDIDGGQGIGLGNIQHGKYTGHNDQITSATGIKMGSLNLAHGQKGTEGQHMIVGKTDNPHGYSTSQIEQYGNVHASDADGGVSWVISGDNGIRVQFSFTALDGFRGLAAHNENVGGSIKDISANPGSSTKRSPARKSFDSEVGSYFTLSPIIGGVNKDLDIDKKFRLT